MGSIIDKLKWFVRLMGDEHVTSELYILYIFVLASFISMVPLENQFLQGFLALFLLLETAKMNFGTKFKFFVVMTIFFANIGILWLAKFWFYLSLLNLIFTIIREVEKW